MWLAGAGNVFQGADGAFMRLVWVGFNCWGWLCTNCFPRISSDIFWVGLDYLSFDGSGLGWIVVVADMEMFSRETKVGVCMVFCVGVVIVTGDVFFSWKMFYRETNWAILKSFGFDYCGWWCVFVLWKMFSRETKGLFARCSGLSLITAAGGEGLIYIVIFVFISLSPLWKCFPGSKTYYDIVWVGF